MLANLLARRGEVRRYAALPPEHMAALNNFLRLVLRAHALPERRAEALGHNGHDPLENSLWAEMMHGDSQSLAPYLDHLQDAGLVRRDIDLFRPVLDEIGRVVHGEQTGRMAVPQSGGLYRHAIGVGDVLRGFAGGSVRDVGDAVRRMFVHGVQGHGSAQQSAQDILRELERPGTRRRLGTAANEYAGPLRSGLASVQASGDPLALPQFYDVAHAILNHPRPADVPADLGGAARRLVGDVRRPLHTGVDAMLHAGRMQGVP